MYKNANNAVPHVNHTDLGIFILKSRSNGIKAAMRNRYELVKAPCISDKRGIKKLLICP
jgi:hypothetical protein